MKKWINKKFEIFTILSIFFVSAKLLIIFSFALYILKLNEYLYLSIKFQNYVILQNS